jgi:hypothetical protein
MSVFHAYEKVERLEKEECDGILNGACYIFEKIDGANAQIYLDTETREIAFGSRNRVLGIGDNLISGDSFRGFAAWVKENREPLQKFFDIHPSFILNGEWLIKHSVQYGPTAYSKFYVFDIYDSIEGRYMGIESHRSWQDLLNLGINFVAFDYRLENPTMQDLMRMLELPSRYGAKFREGIVIKNYYFVNKFGRQPYAKLLHETFQEVKSKPKAPISPDAIELAIQVQYVTAARVEKICQKVKMSKAIDKAHPLALVTNQYDATNVRLEMKDIPQVINMVWYDIITEEMNDILKRLKDPTINFKLLKRLVFERAKEYYIKSLQGEIKEPLKSSIDPDDSELTERNHF